MNMHGLLSKNRISKNIIPILAYILLGSLLLAELAACINAVPSPITPRSKQNLTQYVNPFIGTARAGNRPGLTSDSGDTFPGATYPTGMVQWSPDTATSLPGGYYYSDSTIKGFSLTHFSGRGCTVYQDIPFMPYVGTVNVSPALSPTPYYSHFAHSNEIAQPGYYRVHLDSPDVETELSVTQHTGMGQFTYPATTASTMLINTGGSINGNIQAGVTIILGNHEVTGFATSTVGCGRNRYTLYFAAQFDAAFTTYGTWNGAGINSASTANRGAHTGAFVSFDTRRKQVIRVQVAISFVSIANAQANLTAENAHFNFAAVRQQANTAWNNRLQSILVQGGSVDEKTTFYTALYHSFIHPNIFNDDNGQYLGFDGNVHMLSPGQHAQYENIPGWDQYRSLIRLRAILAPSETSDIAQSLVNDAIQGDGHLPRWEQGNSDSHGMNGDDGAIMVAEAYAFGATSFDTTAALSAMLHGQSKIREGLNGYLTLGYVAAQTLNNSAAVTQEYTNDDFAIAQFAKALGDKTDYLTLSQRSANWQNLYNTASGYIQPRNSDGSWGIFNTVSQGGFQEGNAAQYTWLEPFALRTLFAKMGGNAIAVKRLDAFFTRLNDGPNSPYAFMGNEPCFEVPWEYDFAGAPTHTQEVVRRIQLQLFTNTPGGLPGNDDAGALSSWYIFSAIGLYPEIPGIGGFVIGSPLFPTVTIQLAGGHTLQINASSASDTHPYVQSLQLNGTPTTRLWLPWSTVLHGATLNFTVGSTATSWGSEVEDAPPGF